MANKEFVSALIFICKTKSCIGMLMVFSLYYVLKGSEYIFSNLYLIDNKITQETFLTPENLLTYFRKLLHVIFSSPIINSENPICSPTVVV